MAATPRSEGSLAWAARPLALGAPTRLAGAAGPPAPCTAPGPPELLAISFRFEALGRVPVPVSALPLLSVPAVRTPEHTPTAITPSEDGEDGAPSSDSAFARLAGPLYHLFAPGGKHRMVLMLGLVMTMAIVMLALFVSLQPVRNGRMSGGAPGSFQDRWATVEDRIAGRAGVLLADDFRSGLGNWTSRADLRRIWKFDETGFVIPKEMAIFQPSQGMTDYSLEFLGEASRGALSWAFRVRDYRNYQAAKLVIVRPGPLPLVVLRHYAVVNGRETGHGETVLPLTVRSESLFHVKMDVNGPDFAAYVGDRLIDFWSDPRIPSGGIGFFSGNGEIGRIRWVTVSHQYDALGRICAFLSPSAVSYSYRSHGSWK